MNAPDDEPRSFQLSRGPSDLWILFTVLASGAAIIFVPAAAPWIIRAVLMVVAYAALRWILIFRSLVLAGGQGNRI